MQFIYGAECPQKKCNNECIFSKDCEAIAGLIDKGHAPKCACAKHFYQVSCTCGFEQNPFNVA